MADPLATWVSSTANIRPAGVANVVAKVSGDAAYYDLGVQRDPKIKLSALSKPDTVGRARSWGVKPEITVTSLETKKEQIQSLPALLVNDPVALGIKQMDGIWFIDDGTTTGIRWKLHSDGDFDDFRMIDYTIMGNQFASEIDAHFTITAPTMGASDPGDALVAFAQAQDPANMKPNGLSKVELKVNAVDGAFDDFGEFNTGKYSFECIGPLSKGGRGIPRTHGIKFMFDVKGLETELTKLQLIDLLQTSDLSLKLTHMDGLILTLPYTNVGSVVTFNNDGNADQVRSIDIHSEGIIIKDSTGLIFQTLEASPTVWSALWS